MGRKEENQILSDWRSQWNETGRGMSARIFDTVLPKMPFQMELVGLRATASYTPVDLAPYGLRRGLAVSQLRGTKASTDHRGTAVK